MIARKAQYRIYVWDSEARADETGERWRFLGLFHARAAIEQLRLQEDAGYDRSASIRIERHGWQREYAKRMACEHKPMPLFERKHT